MKKVFLFIVSTSISFSSFTQQNVLKFNSMVFPTKTIPSEFKNSKSEDFYKSAGDVVFSENFSSEISNWTTQGLNGSVWQIDFDGPNGGYSDPVLDIIESPTVGDGFLIFDADFFNAGDENPDLNGSITSPVIDLSTLPGATLNFYHKYRSCCAFAWYPKVHISSDNFSTFQEFDVRVNGINTNDATATELVSLNLSSFLSSTADPSNFQFRFVFEEASNYFWEIDDITIIETQAVDLAIQNLWLEDINFTFEHTDIPLSMAGNLVVQAHVQNFGHTIPANVELNVSVKDASGNEVAQETGGMLSNFLTQENDTLTFETGINLSSLPVGEYSIEATIVSQESDENNSNDVYTRALNLTNHYLGQRVYEKPQVTKSLGLYYGPSDDTSEPLLMGNVMYIENDVALQGLEITLGNTARYPLTVGAEIEIRLYEIDYSQASFDSYHIDQGEYRFFNITADMIPAEGAFKDVLFNFHESISSSFEMNLVGGKYYMVAVYHSGGLNNHFAYSTNTTDDDYSSHYTTSDGTSGSPWYVVARQVHTRLNFDESLSLEENNEMLQFSIYPNPIKNDVMLSFETQNSESIQIEISDLSGKIIDKMKRSVSGKIQKELVDMSSYESGIYLIKLISENGTSTKRVIKK